MSRADSLGSDFAEDHDGHGGADDGDESRRQVIHHDGQGRVHQHVPQQDRAQKVIARFAHRHDGTRVPDHTEKSLVDI